MRKIVDHVEPTLTGRVRELNNVLQYLSIDTCYSHALFATFVVFVTCLMRYITTHCILAGRKCCKAKRAHSFESLLRGLLSNSSFYAFFNLR